MFLLAVVLTSCVPNKPYRTADYDADRAAPELKYKNEKPDVQCRSKAEAPSLCRQNSQEGAAYDLAFIEFDDMGEFWTIGNLNYCPPGSEQTPKCINTKNTQLDHAIELVEQRKKESRPVTVITFIHGWKNNSSPHDEDNDKSLGGFKNWLAELAGQNPKTAYVGVFVAWRGQSIPGDTFLSYWSRRDAAMRVGRASMTEALLRLMFATKVPVVPTIDNQCGKESPTSESKLIIIGHSFGGRILERALSQPMMALLLERRAEADACRREWNEKPDNKQRQLGTLQFQTPADLIVLINTANDSFETKAIIEGMKRMNLRIGPITSTGSFFDSPPFVISILSAGDSATTKLMPFAQAIAAPSQSYNRNYDRDAVSEGQVSSPNEEKPLKQSYFYYHNDAKVAQFVTHNVSQLSSAIEPPSTGGVAAVVPAAQAPNHDPGCFGIQEPRNSFCFSVLRPGHKDYYAAVASNTASGKGLNNNTPFWVINVPSSIIPNHSDIFQPGTNALLSAILRLQDTMAHTHMEAQ
jgi:hypothetical protein